MKLILLHGAPATGKSTVAQSLSELTGVRAIDNHLAIDLARAVFGTSSPEFWDLVHHVRLVALQAAVATKMDALIMTAAYSHPVDLPLYKDYERAVVANGGHMALVYLSCSKATLLERVQEEDRRRRGKISSAEALAAHLERNAFAALPRDACLHLSTEDTSPADNAVAIARHFDLSVGP
ncbi:AAA family ATPase [Limimaricola pyoseonensis]|uniref:AAA domain-containing protein n=1 Tax=Limimaricola pyoseonensis TaxID=521013 RepID=A0A1G7LA72_9RHOB|nr:AAA family ATPase [Limimaricola pyoseonensis]SDF46355.1 AAA domain-containing protein [Limimaricola pyoseonensis]